MKTFALLTLVVAPLLVVGCNSDDDSSSGGEDLGTTESQLVSDDTEAADTDDDLEAGIDEPLSGATDANPGDPADGASDDEVFEKIRKNPGRFFQPAGCITSTRTDNVVVHVFAGCTGPYGLTSFDGTVTSTWTREPGKLSVTHQTDGFKINGAIVTGSRSIAYTRSGATVSKTRTGSWTGTTAKGNAISHQANFVTTYDAQTRCLTRDGSAQTSVGGRSFSRTIDGYERCGIGRGGCPNGGTIALSASNGTESLSLSLEYLGGVRYRVTRPSGRQVTRALVCRPLAG